MCISVYKLKIIHLYCIKLKEHIIYFFKFNFEVLINSRDILILWFIKHLNVYSDQNNNCFAVQ